MFTYTVLALKVAFLTPLTQYTASLECALVVQHQWGWVRAVPSVGCQLHLVCGHILHVEHGHREHVPQSRSPDCVGALVLACAGMGHLHSFTPMATALVHHCVVCGSIFSGSRWDTPCTRAL